MQHKHGGDVYTYRGMKDFSANINFRGMPEKVRLAALAAVDASLHYPDPEYRTLRAALARRENILLGRGDDITPEHVICGCGEGITPEHIICAPEKGITPEHIICAPEKSITPEHIICAPEKGITPEHIICGNGAAELMFALAAAKRPREALLAVPSFFEYEQALTSCGCAVRRFVMKAEQDFVLERSFLDAVSEKTDMMILGNPNNPTGRLLEAGFLEALLELCGRRNIFLVLDESFFDFLSEADQRRTFSGAGRALQYPQLFVLRSFTKMYAMPGLRFGYGICSDRGLLDNMHLRLQPWNVSVPAAAAAEAAAEELAFAKETAAWTAANRAVMKQGMEQNGYRVYPSDTNFLLFEGPADLKEFCIRHGFLIRSCGNFPGLASRGKQAWFRICVRSGKENEELLQVLKKRMQ